MRRVAVNLWILPLLATALLQSGFGSTQQQNNTPMSYTGEIMDRKCGDLGSHNQVMTKEGIKTAKDRTLWCIKDNNKFVLYTVNSKTYYNLDDQDKTQDYAGEKVTITGTYDGPTKTIHIQSIIVAP